MSGFPWLIIQQFTNSPINYFLPLNRNETHPLPNRPTFSQEITHARFFL